MSNSYPNNSRAKAEQIARREAYFKRLDEIRKSGKVYKKPNTNSYLPFIGKVEMEKLAPIALIIHVFAILFAVSWIITKMYWTINPDLKSTPAVSNYQSFTVPEGGAIIKFSSVQSFASNRTPLYSELELQIIDKNYGHVYSVYKDLWQELHPNGEGGNSVYHDWSLDFEIAIHKGGDYYIRPISYNNNEYMVRTAVYSKSFGSLYITYGLLTFGILSILLLVLYQYIGSYRDHINIVKEVRTLFLTKKALIAFGIAFILFGSSWYAAINYSGYASFGEDTYLPSTFYNKHNVIYLG